MHDDLEYVSMLLNLQYALRCDTLASNSCRVIDELRATVGGKFEGAHLSSGSTASSAWLIPSWTFIPRERSSNNMYSSSSCPVNGRSECWDQTRTNTIDRPPALLPSQTDCSVTPQSVACSECSDRARINTTDRCPALIPSGSGCPSVRITVRCDRTDSPGAFSWRQDEFGSNSSSVVTLNSSSDWKSESAADDDSSSR